jgi:hypothetical protein
MMNLVKKVFVVGLVGAVALAIAPVSNIFAADEPVDVILSGEPVDMVCYLGGKSGEGHAACATACVTKGNPIGLVVEEDGKRVLYLVLADGGKAAKDLFAEHMGTIVDVTGKASKKDGMSIIVASEVSAEEEEWFPEDVVGAGSVVIEE